MRALAEKKHCFWAMRFPNLMRSSQIEKNNSDLTQHLTYAENDSLILYLNFLPFEVVRREAQLEVRENGEI